MNVGKPKRVYRVEPLTSPIPQKREPQRPPSVPVKPGSVKRGPAERVAGRGT